MAAVWFFFALGVVAFCAGAVVAGIWLYGFVASYIVTAKEYVQKRIALRRERINKLEVKDVEIECDKPEACEEHKEEIEVEADVNPEEIAKDILGK